MARLDLKPSAIIYEIDSGDHALGLQSYLTFGNYVPRQVLVSDHDLRVILFKGFYVEGQ
jgi:hypothetical protein